VLTDSEARKIACEWHGGQGSPLYALCSTGAINKQTTKEIDITIGLQPLTDEPNIRELESLRQYVSFHGTRGPIDGWANRV